jgi:hypothetical protein
MAPAVGRNLPKSNENLNIPNCRSRGCAEEGGLPGQTLIQPEPESKSCCGLALSQTVSIRWFIVMIAFVGICCSVVGTVLGAMKASGREHLTVSLLMIGERCPEPWLPAVERIYIDNAAFGIPPKPTKDMKAARVAVEGSGGKPWESLP